MHGIFAGVVNVLYNTPSTLSLRNKETNVCRYGLLVGIITSPPPLPAINDHIAIIVYCVVFDVPAAAAVHYNCCC